MQNKTFYCSSSKLVFTTMSKFFLDCENFQLFKRKSVCGARKQSVIGKMREKSLVYT